MLDKCVYLFFLSPLMPRWKKKKKAPRLYYSLVESARVDGQPRIVHQAYLGTAEKLAELVQQKSAPVPLSATLRDFGLPGDRKSTRLNSSHSQISYAVFCLKKKKTNNMTATESHTDSNVRIVR